MENLWDEKLCDERHKKLDENVTDLYEKRDQLVTAINGKFNKIMIGIFATLLTVIGSLITYIATK
jgi:hypothetical protein